MTLNIDTIAEALAAAYVSLTPPTNEPAIRGSTSHPPNAIPGTPYVIVWTQSGEVIYQSGERQGETQFEVILYLDVVGDLPRQMERLQKWIGVMLDATHAASKLGVGPPVLKGLPTGWRLDVLSYGDKTYEALIVTVTVWTQDTVTLVP